MQIEGLRLEDVYTFPLFFSLQLLPHSEILKESSVRATVQAISTRILEAFDSAIPSWQLHVFAPKSALTGEQYGRARVIEEGILNELKQRRRNVFRAYTPSPERDTALIQVVTLDDNSVVLSLLAGEERSLLRARISPHRAGFIAIPDDKAPPSRAHKKLREAIEVFDLNPRKGEAAVDLGASPGGWTAVLVQRGCRVIAVDRSPLDEKLMKDRRVTFAEGNAFSWTPKAPVDWLVCDVIATPDKSIALLDRWVSAKWCRFFCVTIKFKGEPEIEALTKARTLLSEKATWYDGRQLTHNKNEVTVVGRVR